MDIHSQPAGEQDEAISAVCICVSALSVCDHCSCPKCIRCACVLCMRVPSGSISAWLDLGTQLFIKFVDKLQSSWPEDIWCYDCGLAQEILQLHSRRWQLGKLLKMVIMCKICFSVDICFWPPLNTRYLGLGSVCQPLC